MHIKAIALKCSGDGTESRWRWQSPIMLANIPLHLNSVTLHDLLERAVSDQSENFRFISHSVHQTLPPLHQPFSRG